MHVRRMREEVWATDAINIIHKVSHRWRWVKLRIGGAVSRRFLTHRKQRPHVGVILVFDIDFVSNFYPYIYKEIN